MLSPPRLWHEESSVCPDLEQTVPSSSDDNEENIEQSAMQAMAFLVAYSILQEPLRLALGHEITAQELHHWWALINSRIVDCPADTLLPLGLDIVNHSFSPNAVFVCGPGPSLSLLALEDIAKSDQVLINYAPGAPPATVYRQYGCLVDLRSPYAA